MDFSLTTLFVLPNPVVLPTVGGPELLLPGQVGVYLPTYLPATAGNIAAAKYIYIKQGRRVPEPGLGTITSDKIYSKNIVNKYKVVGNAGFSNQIMEFANFQMKYDTTYSVTLRLFSNYTDVGFFNGMTKTVTIITPCMNCGDDPCDTLLPADVEDAVDEFVEGINKDALLKQLVVAERIGTGATSILRVTGKALPTPQVRQNPGVNRHMFDRLYFFGWAYEGAETTQDVELFYEVCGQVADVTLKQRALWPRGTSAEMKELEKQYHSYTSTFKQLFADSDWNNTFQSAIVDGVIYDTYYIKFTQEYNISWQNEIHIDEAVLLIVPTGQAAALETLLETFFGDFDDKTSVNISTTTTTSTTTTSTTSTTTLQP
jgi:hypothetical protein